MTKALLSLAQLERIKDIVATLSGKLEIRFYLPGDRDYYMISFENGESTYRKVTACSGEPRETFEKVWPSRMFDIVTTPGVSARLKRQEPRPEGRGLLGDLDDDHAWPEWFEILDNPEAFDALYRRVLTFVCPNSSLDQRVMGGE
jgi:hypothetical protein